MDCQRISNKIWITCTTKFWRIRIDADWRVKMKRTRSSPSVSRDTSNRIQLGRRCIKRDYVDFWPKIEAFLDIIFADCTIGTNRANTDKSFQSSKQTDASCHRSVDSFESCYRLVYSCVINSHGERLANDLFRKCEGSLLRFLIYFSHCCKNMIKLEMVFAW